MRGALRRSAAVLFAAILAGCGNDPYPLEDSLEKILYQPFDDPPKTLDPQVAYSVVDHQVIGYVYDTLLGYHYLKRPFTLIPGMAETVPEAIGLSDGRVAYRFRLRPDLWFHEDPAFEKFSPGTRTRTVEASDVAFSLLRVADPAVVSPVIEALGKISGLVDFGKRLDERRRADPEFAALRIDEQYRRAGPVDGVRVLGPLELEIVLDDAYPQILYWFAMPFTSPVPWEAIAAYDGVDGRESFAEHPVGSGPFVLSRYDKRSRIVLERNDRWYGVLHPEWKAPAATYPSEGAPGDAEAGLLDPDYVGRPLPFLSRIEFRREKEPIPTFTKFLQGYYDASGVVKESFDRVIQKGELSPEMRGLGITLAKSVEPAISYLGFNMDDAIVGASGGERSEKLRQAMSLAIDSKEFLRLFANGRGLPAQTPIPPGIFGYDAGYQNPFRQPDLDLAKKLLAEAGWADGIDPTTGRPLRLTFDVGDTGAAAMLQFGFYTSRWRRIGLDVEIAATSYNQFQDKVRRGAYQIFTWGWVADYPDPENFLFLLWTPMSRTKSGGPNTANFSNPRYDALFEQMKAMTDTPERLAIIHEMRSILEQERPWIENFYPERYALYHGWVRNEKPAGLSIPTAKYLDIDAELRALRRAEWNVPITWPAWALAAILVVVIVPGVVTFLRERQ
ncbi:Heme-binding protein A [Myxococcaceae bacterium]|nr:Heme-binding protein A [Myxococcaceae bacterium]